MKVNLLKTRVKSDPLEQTNTGFGKTVLDSSIHLKGSSLSGEDRKNLLTNLFLMCIFSVAIYYYQGYASKKVKFDKKKLTQQVAVLKTDLQKKELKVKDVAKYKLEGDEFKRKIMAIKELSKMRLVELKALDYMQNIIPEKLWFSSVKYSDRTFVIKGNAIEDNSFNTFLKELESSSFFGDIVIITAKEIKDDSGSKVVFEIQTSLRTI